jgi:CheY-like chemotaxis protein
MFILLVDDDFDDCELFTEIVKEIHPTSVVETLHDGIEALKYLNEEGNGLPDLIFLDINMPRMNGKQLVLVMKNDDRLKNIPVTVYSTSIPEKEIAYYEAFGINCLVKPSTYNALKDSLSNIITPALKM